MRRYSSLPSPFFARQYQVRGRQAACTSVANASTVYKRRPSSGLSRPLFPRWILIIPLKVAPALAASGPDTREPASSYLSQLVIPTADYPDSWVTMPVNDRSRGNSPLRLRTCNNVGASCEQFAANDSLLRQWQLLLSVPRRPARILQIVQLEQIRLAKYLGVLRKLKCFSYIYTILLKYNSFVIINLIIRCICPQWSENRWFKEESNSFAYALFV